MSDVPNRALYKCPKHGIFMVDTGGMLAKERSCTVRVYTNGTNYPCGTLSPMAQVDDPDLNNKPITGLDGDSLDTLRESIAIIKAQRQAEKEGRELVNPNDERPNYFFGGKDNRRNGRKIQPQQAVLIDPEQAEFEVAERERMRAAMSEGWDD